MPARIKTERSGETTAFTSEGKLVMNFGTPCVVWSFSVTDLEQWLTTIEETINDIPSAHRWSLKRLYFSLKAAHVQHQKQHEEIVTEAPTSDDLMNYLVSYSAAMAWEAMEGKK